MKKILLSMITIFCCVSVVSCSSKRTIQLAAPTYEVIDNSTRDNERPSYVFGSVDSKFKKNDKDEYVYFIGEDDNLDRTLCYNGASVNAAEKIANQLSQEVKATYTKVINNNNGNLDKQVSSTLQRYIEMKLTGVEEVEKYWELRNYKKELGSKKDKELYYCYVLSKIKKKSMDEMVSSILDEVLKSINK